MSFKLDGMINEGVTPLLRNYSIGVVENWGLCNQINENCLYENKFCKGTVFEELNKGLDNKFKDELIKDFKKKPFYYFYDVYMECPQIFKQLPATDFFDFSCYIKNMMDNGFTMEEAFKTCEDMYKDERAGFLMEIREYGSKMFWRDDDDLD